MGDLMSAAILEALDVARGFAARPDNAARLKELNRRIGFELPEAPPAGPLRPLRFDLKGSRCPIGAAQTVGTSWQINAEIRAAVRALWCAHLLSANTSAEGFDDLRGAHYGPAAVRVVGRSALAVLQDPEQYKRLMMYAAALCRVWQNRRGKTHKCADYLGFFAGLHIPTLR